MGVGAWELPCNSSAAAVPVGTVGASKMAPLRHVYAPVTFPEDAGAYVPVCSKSNVGVGGGCQPRVCPWAPARAAAASGAACSRWSPVSRRRWAGGGWHLDVGPGFANTERRSLAGDVRQGVIVLVLLSDCGPGAGGTALLPLSHHWVASEMRAREAAALPAYSHEELNNLCVARMRAMNETGRLLLPGCAGAVAGADAGADAPGLSAGGGALWGGDGPVCAEQVTGRAGDVILLHPLLLHSGTTNCAQQPRQMLNGMARYTPAAFARNGGCRLVAATTPSGDRLCLPSTT